MKTKIFKWVATAFFALVLSACGPSSCTGGDGNQDGNLEPVMKAYNGVLTEAQLDSLCVADTLSRDLSEWLNSSYIDHETNEAITKYVWIKSISEDLETTYILIPNDTLYNFTKRTINLEEEEEE